MKKFKVTFTTTNGRRTHRHFNAPNLSEAQAQFASCTRSSVSNCEWSECSYHRTKYKSAKTGEIFLADVLYDRYLAKHPKRNITFIKFAAGEML